MQRLLWLALFLALAGHARTAEIAVVLSGDSGPYKDALEGLKAVVGQEMDVATLPAMPDLGAVKVVVTFGGEAALKKYPSGAVLVAALLPDPKLKPKHAGGLTRIGLAPEPALLLAKIKGLQPGTGSLAVLDNGAYGPYMAGLKAAGPGAGLNVSVKQVEDMAGLVAVLPGLKGAVKALWVPPDPLFMNPKTFMLLAQFCRGSGIAMIAPIAGLAKAGALAGIAPSFKQQGHAAGIAAIAVIAGTPPGDWVYSDKAEFIINKTVATELGISAAAQGKADSAVE